MVLVRMQGAPDESACNVLLVSQDSRSPCIRGSSYGCREGGDSMWVRGCRGTFRCGGDGPEVSCGFPPGQASYHCRCDGQGTLAPGKIPTRGEYFLALGGSNTCGAAGPWVNGSKAPSFAELTAAALQSRGRVSGLINNCVPAAGPIFAATCARRFIPRAARFATVEYLPNMGFAERDNGLEYGAVETLLQRLQRLSARVVLINILTVVHGCRSCVTNMTLDATHDKLLALAGRYGADTVTVNASDPEQQWLFTSSNPHLNGAGHSFVHAELMRLFDTPAAPPSPPVPSSLSKSSSSLLTSCRIGDEISPLVSHSSSFARVDHGSHSGNQKVSWEARRPGATLALCFEHALERRAASSGGASSRYVVALGFMVSHPENQPLFGNVTVRCDGGCACNHARMDTLTTTMRATVTRFMRLHASVRSPAAAAVARTDPPSGSLSEQHCPLSKCTVLVSNSVSSEEPHRVVLRAVIVGPMGVHTQFVDPFQLNRMEWGD